MTEEKKLEPELRFPGFHEPWEEKKLGDLGDFYRGLSGKNKDSFINGNKKYIQYLNIFENTVIKDNFNEYGYVLVNNNEKQNVVMFGDLLFTQSSETLEEIGMTSVYLDNLEVYLNSFSFGFRFDKCFKVDFRYIAYLFRSNTMRNRIMIEGQGSTRYNLASSRLEKLYVPLCEVQEQEKIGKFFYAIDKKLNLQRERIEELKSYKKGMMQRIFDQEIRFKDEDGRDYPDWEEKKLGEVSNIKTGNSNVKDATEDGAYTFFDRSIIIKRINKYDYDEEAIIYPGEGSEFYPRYYNGKYALHQRAYSLTSKYLNLKYLTYYLMLKNNYFLKMAVGSTVKSLRMENFIKCPVELPSLPEQEKIANFLSAIDRRIELEEEKLELYDDFKKGLMQRMFV